MNTPTKIQQKFEAVANYLGNIAAENNGQFKTKDHEMAGYVATLMTEMTTASKVEHIKAFAPALKKSRGGMSPTIELWTYICSSTNWLSWAWHAMDEPELSQAWADVWYDVNHFSLETLKDEELTYYIQKTD